MQNEPWFEGFAGAAFTWQDAPTMDASPVFEVVANEHPAKSDDGAVVTFTVEKP